MICAWSRLRLLVAGWLLVCAPACGSDTVTNETAGGAAGSGAGGASSGPASSSGTTSSTGGTPDGNVDCSSAIPFERRDGVFHVADALEPLTADEYRTQDEDYFTFNGKKGDVIFLVGDAKPDADGFAVAYPDLVLTVLDEGKTIAEDDDPIPRNTQDSRIYTVLPEDGEYCVRVMDFCRWLTVVSFDDPSDGLNERCSILESDTVAHGYDLRLWFLEDGQSGFVRHVEDQGVPQLDYALDEVSGFSYVDTSTAVLTGFFEDGKIVDHDVFAFSVSPDTLCTPTETCDALQNQDKVRTTAYFEVFPTRAAGAIDVVAYDTGSTVPTGKVWITTKDQPDSRIAEIDGTRGAAVVYSGLTSGLTLEAPIEFGKDYFLHVQGAEGWPDLGSNPFYVLLHYGGGSHPLEKETAPGENDTPETAEKMKSTGYVEGGFGYAVAGRLSTATDVDWFELYDAGFDDDWVLYASCAGQRIGSGLRGLRLSVLTPTRPNIAPEETADAETKLDAIPLPGGATPVYLKVEAEDRDPSVTSDHYKCSVGFGPP